MPWVRIDENALDHPKIGALPDGAFRLWVQGLAYCQKFLTDGAISDLAVRGLHAYSPKRRIALVESGLWDETPEGIQVHDFLDWNESRERVMTARRHARDRVRKMREKKHGNGVTHAERSPNTPCVVECRSSGSEVTERGLGKTTPQRASAFCQWYEETHERLFGVGYMGTQRDYQKAMELCEKFSDQQLRDAALVWFGMDDDFATNGTRTVPKFAARITGCLQAIRAQGIA